MWFGLFICTLSALWAAPVLAGAWTLDRGKTSTFVASTFTYGDHGFDDDGNLVKVPEYQKFVLSGALEYGVRPWLTAVLRAELREERMLDAVYTTRLPSPLFDPTEVTDVTFYDRASRSYAAGGVGARVRLLQASPWVVSGEMLLGSGGLDSAGLGAPSDGPYLETRALVGASRTILGRNAYADIAVGYRHRFRDDDADEVLLDVTLGTQVLPRWMVLAQTFTTVETDGETHYTKASGSLVYSFNDRLRIQAGVVGTVHGRNAIRELGGTLSFWWEF
ncbi:hypothetical protein RDV64_05440 [Acuticoccus sp. MNP-M23]|uniref:hypothetical protein n=1 Tax=Acuticoccus sp. MNP-M23 TaxID=3072793 RepID=UPI0028168B5D|nr:hypothetical protein [Acuticoccus sp. MNP-M23]WMS43842.1 hypothetical protein RDV64_05440 [Acuticoccus sp. MNP-M23]